VPAAEIERYLVEQLRALATNPDMVADVVAEANRQRTQRVDETTVSDQALHATLQLFDPVWEVLYPIERVRILRLLLGQVDYNGKTGKLGITFHPLGIVTLHEEIMAAAARLAGQASGEETI
jgi:hypothetical protein